MKILIDNYTIYEKKDELIFEIAAPQVENFPFIQSEAYISKKNIDKKVFFISTKDKSNIITFKNMDIKDLKKLANQKTMIVALLEAENKYKKIYQFDIKKIK